ncbi:unnamed protein product [Spirodela intermedia]|uniref:Glutaredoxin domain-containing protein n=1 Tax=Spirodela intermedia TaxID=51605 RepID=A0A7I8J8M6_SPIIN|nr:unnamed protein product [Spirodela intermedia]CAA6665792.1 unnamed protein product [Spirodela intermedia]
MQQAIPYGSGRRGGSPPPPLLAWAAARHVLLLLPGRVIAVIRAEHGHRQHQQQRQRRQLRHERRRRRGGIRSLVAENPVLILSRGGCCMCHVVKRLLLGLGVNPVVCELDEDREEAAVMEELTGAPRSAERHQWLTPAPPQLPAVFIGGRFMGGLDRLMAAHISGDLVPILKDAGALWL